MEIFFLLTRYWKSAHVTLGKQKNHSRSHLCVSFYVESCLKGISRASVSASSSFESWKYIPNQWLSAGNGLCLRREGDEEKIHSLIMLCSFPPTPVPTSPPTSRLLVPTEHCARWKLNVSWDNEAEIAFDRSREFLAQISDCKSSPAINIVVTMVKGGRAGRALFFLKFSFASPPT